MGKSGKFIYAIVLGILLLAPVAVAKLPASEQEPEVITVSAAASLTEAFTDIASQFEEKNPGTDVNLSFAGSGDLRMQIEEGVPIDVFASADQRQMEILINKTLIENSSRKDFAQNSLVLIVPENSTLNITDLEDLANPEIKKISIGNPETAPVGEYSRLALNEACLWGKLEKKLVLAEDVKLVLEKVEKGEVDAGFVYMTDAKAAQPCTIKVIASVPVNTTISYPIAVVSSSEHKEKAQKFIDFVTGEEGQKILEKYGFTVSDAITVSAAASLTEAFTDISSQFEKENPGMDINLSFAGSGDLRMQIEEGDPVDVFASADQLQMDILDNESLIDNSSRENFAQNSLVLIVPKNSTLNITDLKDLAAPEVKKISIGNPETAPVGEYSRLALNEAGLWSQLENKLVLAEDVKQVLAKVEKEKVDAGFVYMTDAKAAQPCTIKTITSVPVSTPINYPIAVVSSSEQKEEAQEFLDFVTGEEGQEILEAYGFTVSDCEAV